MSGRTQTAQSVLEDVRRLTENGEARLTCVKDSDDLADCSSEPGLPAVSVIVPVHAGGAALVQCLEALARLSPPPLEVIVVDDGGSPADSRPHAPDVRVVRLPQRRGPAAARNCGASVARGDVLLFVDADVLVPPTAVATVQACLNDQTVAAVIGPEEQQIAQERAG